MDGLSVRHIGKPKVASLFAVLTVLSYFHRFSVFMWTGENDSNTLRVDTTRIILNICVWTRLKPSSKTQGQSVGSGERARRKFSSTGKKAPGYRLSPNYFQNFKRMPAPDWAQKMLCIIVPNRPTVSPEFFS